MRMSWLEQIIQFVQYYLKYRRMIPLVTHWGMIFQFQSSGVGKLLYLPRYFPVKYFGQCETKKLPIHGISTNWTFTDHPQDLLIYIGRVELDLTTLFKFPLSR